MGTSPTAEPPPGDPLAELRDRIRRTQEAAEQLAAQVAAARKADDEARGAGAGADVPPAGWQSADEPRRDPELIALVQILELARGLVPRDVQHQLTELVRDLLVALRALIDWWLERNDARRSAPVEAQDIEID